MRTNADLRHIFPVISATITDGNGTTYSLTGRDIPSGSLSFKAGTSPAGTFAVGGAVISSVSFALLNAASYASLVWKNAKVSFTLTCDQTAVNMGEYYIVNHSEAGGAITVTAFDALKILDSYEMHELNITYPTTVGALATAIAAAHGLTVTGIRNPSATVDDPDDGRTTQRACISYLAQLCGQYVTVAGSVIRFGWYDIASPVSNGNTFGHDWGTADVTITGVRVNDKDSTQVEDRGSAGYRIEIAGNPFITATNVSAVADTIWAACGGMSFRAGSAEILASPAFEAGDVVTVNTPDETGVKLILSNITYTPDVSMAITSDADAQDGDLALNKSPYVKHGEDARQEADAAIDEQLADPSSALSQAIAAGGGGGGGDTVEIKIHGSVTLQAGGCTGIHIDGNGISTFAGGTASFYMGLPGVSSYDAVTRIPAASFAGYVGGDNARDPFPITVCGTLRGVSSSMPSGYGVITMTGRHINGRDDAIEILMGTMGAPSIPTDMVPYLRVDKPQTGAIDFVPFNIANTPYLVKHQQGYWQFRSSY